MLRARSHSHTRTTVQPSLRKARVTSLSRALFRESFAAHHSARVFGIGACFGFGQAIVCSQTLVPSIVSIMATGKRWTRDELLVALKLYHKLTFGQLHARQPATIALAEKIGRGANSLAMKLCNFASLDPALKLRGIKGLPGASALDRAV